MNVYIIKHALDGYYGDYRSGINFHETNWGTDIDLATRYSKQAAQRIIDGMVENGVANAGDLSIVEHGILEDLVYFHHDKCFVHIQHNGTMDIDGIDYRFVVTIFPKSTSEDEHQDHVVWQRPAPPNHTRYEPAVILATYRRYWWRD